MSLRTSDDFETLKDLRLSQSMERGVAILRCFTPEKQMLGIKEIADELGMSPSTTHRYVVTLVALGWLEQPQSSDRKYRLGLRPTDIGMQMLKGHPLYARARPCLEELRRNVSYTVSLAAREDDEIVLLDRLQGFRGHARLGLNLGRGSRLPIYCTSLGKTLLAYLPLEEREMIVNRLSLHRRGPNTMTDRDLLLRELELIRIAGFAVSNEELRAGVHSVAAPVRNYTGAVVAAVNVAAPKSMVSRSQMTNDFVPHVLATTERISTNLKGWTGEW